MWFSVNILLKCSIGNEPKDDYLWQENIILCFADSPEDAHEKMEKFAHNLENEYKNNNGETVRWIYDGILSIYQLDDDIIKDNSVVFSRHLNKDEVLSLRKTL
jgi:hypothetical protein